jgi:hypothetical protein
VGKPEGKRPLARSKCGWKNNIKMALREIGWGGVDLIGLAQDTDQWKVLVNTVMNLWVPQNIGKFLSSCATGGFPRRAQLRGGSSCKCTDLSYKPSHIHVMSAKRKPSGHYRIHFLAPGLFSRQYN